MTSAKEPQTSHTPLEKAMWKHLAQLKNNASTIICNKRHLGKIFSSTPQRTLAKMALEFGNIPQKEGEVETGMLFEVLQYPRTRGRGLKNDS